jgi:hypothetical protein
MGEVEERRREKRDLFTITVEYEPSFLEAGTPPQRGIGLTTNISSRGLGLYTNSPLKIGESIKVFSTHLSDEPKIAEVKWCSQVSHAIFRAGLMFV